MPAIRKSHKKPRPHPHGKSGKLVPKHHTGVSDGGRGSTGDMNKVLWKRKHQSKGKMKAKKKFKAKVEQAIESDFPLSRVITQAGGTMIGATAQQQYNQIEILNVSDCRGVLQQITQQTQTPNDWSERFHLMDFRLDGFYSNAANSVVILDWYTLVPRTDNINGPNTDWIQSVSSVASGGEGSTGGQTAATVTYNTVGLNPFMFSEFCSKWLVLEKRRVVLQPGETKEFHYYRHVNRTIDGARFQQGGTQYDSIKGLTKYWYIMGFGQPVHDGTTSTNTSTAPLRVDFNVIRTYTARAISNPVAPTRAAQVQTYVGSIYPTVSTPHTVEEFNPSAVTPASNAP